MAIRAHIRLPEIFFFIYPKVSIGTKGEGHLIVKQTLKDQRLSFRINGVREIWKGETTSTLFENIGKFVKEGNSPSCHCVVEVS